MVLLKRVNCIVLDLLCKPNVYTTKATANLFAYSQEMSRSPTQAAKHWKIIMDGFWPTIRIREGLRKFAEWYKGYTANSAPTAR